MNATNISSLQNVDLNLLVVLDALLRERSATRAALSLHVTQSAVSNALRRLRALFDDALLVRTPYGFVPTARAERLAPSLHALLEHTSALLARAPDGAEAERTFTLACTDAIAVLLGAQLLTNLAKWAPRARLRFVTLDHEVRTDGLASGEVDLLIGIPPAVPKGCRGESVYEDPIVCVARTGHPRVRTRLSLEAYVALPHVELALFGEADDRVDRALARVGATRRITLLVPHFSSIPLAVAGSDCVAALSKRLAAAYALPFGLRIWAPPIPLPSLHVKQYWHRRADHDPALAQLREAVRKVANATPVPRAPRHPARR